MARKKRDVYTLYNEELKMAFIEGNYNENTHNNVKRLLSNAYEMEVALGKDLSNFNFEEVEEFLKGLNKKTVQSLSSTLSYLRKYTDYAIERGYVPTRINYFNLFRGTEMLREYVNIVAENVVDEDSKNGSDFGKYVTREELHNIINFCINPQDGALFGLLFEGVMGVDHDELRNLKKKDCNIDTGELLLTRDDGTTRTIAIEDSEILMVLEDAIDQQTYEKNNGNNDHLRTPRFELADTPYVFRVSGRGDHDRIKTTNINNRLKKMAQDYDNPNPFLNPQNIWISGQIDYAKRLKRELELDELSRTHYEKINERYGYDKQYWYTTKQRIAHLI